ncbi:MULTISPECIES: hypothetical protein [unclassified Neisseria]|nr:MULTISPECIES: hypothetical protein [unclassified Neisseria]
MINESKFKPIKNIKLKTKTPETEPLAQAVLDTFHPRQAAAGQGNEF